MKSAPQRARFPAAMALLLLLLATAPARPDLNDGLVGYWSFDEGTGTIAHDSSGYGNHGTILGAAWSPGVSGAALNFDGIDDYVYVGDCVVCDNTAELTICLWVEFRSFGTPGIWAQNCVPLVSKWYSLGDVTGRNAYCFLERDSELALFVAGTGGGAYVEVPHAMGVAEWHHLAAVFDAGYILVYVDGRPTGSGTVAVSSIQNASEPLKMGDWFHGYDPGYRTFDGCMDEVRIYGRALSQDEIQQLMWEANPGITEQYLSGDQSDTSGTSRDPVNTATGSFFHQESDLSAATRGGLMAFTRYYNSAATEEGTKARSHERTAQEQGGARLVGGQERLTASSAAQQEFTAESTGHVQPSTSAVVVALSALPCATLGCWLLQRGLRGRTRTAHGRFEARSIQRVADTPGRSGQMRNRSEIRGHVTHLRAGRCR